MYLQIADKLRGLDIPYFDIKVFEQQELNVQVRCVGIAAALLWVRVLAAIGATVSCSPTAWEVANRLDPGKRPSPRKGWLVSAVF